MRKEKSRLNQSTDPEKCNIDFQLILNHICDVVYCLAPDNDNNFYFKYANQTFYNKSGLTPEDVIGKRIQDVMPEINRITDEKKFKEAISNKKIVGWRMSTEQPSGKKVGYVQVIPEFDANDKCLNVTVIIKDLTSQENIEKSSTEAEERWKFAIEGAGDGLWDWNAQTNEVFFSKQWKKMLGFEEHEIENTLDEWEKRVHPDDKEKVYADVNKHFEGKTEFYENQHRVLCKDGTYKWILDRGKVMQKAEDGKPLRVIGTHTDISERKKIENELYYSTEKLNAFLNSSMDAIMLTSTDGNIYSANPAACKILGRTEEEICNLDRNKIVDTKDPRLETFLVKRAKTGEAFGELKLFKKDGSSFPAEISSSLFKDNNGNVYTSMIIRDISERKKAEEEIIKLNRELEEKIKERTIDLEEKIEEIKRMNRLFVGRELRMIELKEKMKELKEKRV